VDALQPTFLSLGWEGGASILVRDPKPTAQAYLFLT
jgi:hypothetical protein